MRIVLDTNVLVSGLLSAFDYPKRSRQGVPVVSPRGFLELYRSI